jgi:hypothetical protein
MGIGVRSLLAGFIVAAGLSSCAVVTQPAPTASDQVQQASLYLAVAPKPVEPQALGMQAMFEGVLGVTPSGCLGIRSPRADDAETAPVIFPAGTELTADGRGIEIPNVGLVELGSPISSGGGTVQWSDVMATYVPDPCVADQIAVLYFG